MGSGSTKPFTSPAGSEPDEAIFTPVRGARAGAVAVLALSAHLAPAYSEVIVAPVSSGWSVQGGEAPVHAVLDALGKAAGFEVEVLGPPILRTVDADFTTESVSTALQRLLPNANSLLVYDAKDPGRVRRVTILPAGSPSPPSGREPVATGPAPAEIVEAVFASSDPLPEQESADGAPRIVPTYLLDTEQALEALEQALGDRHEIGRRWAVEGLGEFALLGHERAIIALGQVLFSESLPELRVSAVDWLKAVGDDRSAAFLQAARQDSHPGVRAAAAAH